MHISRIHRGELAAGEPRPGGLISSTANPYPGSPFNDVSAAERLFERISDFAAQIVATPVPPAACEPGI